MAEVHPVGVAPCACVDFGILVDVDEEVHIFGFEPLDQLFLAQIAPSRSIISVN